MKQVLVLIAMAVAFAATPAFAYVAPAKPAAATKKAAPKKDDMKHASQSIKDKIKAKKLEKPAKKSAPAKKAAK